MEKTAVSLNIAILPDATVRNQAIILSEHITKKIATHFTLNTNTLLPHVTIYQARFPKQNLKKVVQKAKEIARLVQPFTIELNLLSVEYETFFFWHCKKIDQLLKLHKDIVDATNKLREGLVLSHLAGVTGLSEEDRKDIQMYGALLIGPRYRPHITLTRLLNSTDSEKALHIIGKKKKMQFLVKNVIVGYLGDHGTVNGIVETIPLGAK